MKMKVTKAAIIVCILLLLVFPATAEFKVTGISPATGVNTGTLNFVTVTGTEFPGDASRVVLNMSGQENITASGGDASRISDTQMLCNLNLLGAQWGKWNVSVANSTSNWSAPKVEGFTITTVPPTLTAVDLTQGTNNYTALPIKITGLNFLTGARVNVTNSSASPDMFNAENVVVNGAGTEITCTLNLTNKIGAWQIFVNNTDGQITSTGSLFTIYNPGPTISGLDITTGVNTPGSAPINVRTFGTNFVTGASIVFAKGIAVIPNTVILPITSTHIDASLNLSSVPVGYYNVTVTNPGGLYNNTTTLSAFRVFYPAAPVVTGISPSSGPNDANITTVVIGSGFEPNANIVLSRSPYSNITGTVNSYNSTTINCTFPIFGQTTGFWNVIVTNDDTRSSNTNIQFHITNPKPQITTISPINGSNTNPALAVQIVGTGFIDTTTPVVTLSKGSEVITATEVVVTGTTNIGCKVNLEGHTAQSYNVTVTNTADGQSSDPLVNGFSVTQPDPTVSTIVPASGINNEVKTVNITGNGFKSGAIARLVQGSSSIQNLTSLSVSSDGNQITGSFNLAGASTGLWNVTVTNLYGSPGVKVNAFTISNPYPVVTGIQPSSGLNDDSALGIYNLTGSNFKTGAVVTFSKTGHTSRNATSVVNVSSSKITCFIDLTSAAVGFWNVTVTNTDGQVSDPLVNQFYIFYPQAPGLADIQPGTGVNIAPVNVLITGSGFESGIIANLTLASTTIPATSLVRVNESTITCIFNITGQPVGIYDLMVRNDDLREDTLPNAFTVTGPVAPVANFTGVPTTGTAPLTVTFTDSSTNTPTSWNWSFGDGSVVNATLRNPVHTYASNGTYTVSLNATNAGGSNTKTAAGYITVTAPVVAPVANFTGAPTTGTAPLTVAFTDSSTNTPTSWNWSFGDGSVVNATLQNPVHTYASNGTYTVSLNATNAGGSNTKTVAGYITVTSAPLAPVANFTGAPTTGTAPLTVAFTDSSMNTPTSWNWSFGDGSVVNATLQNPVHTYASNGIYTVSLNATNAGGSNTKTAAGYINVTAPVAPPVANFTASPTAGFKPLTVQFTDTSVSNITEWKWTLIGDEAIYLTKNPLFTYNEVGNYTVKLKVWNASGDDKITKTDYIVVTNKPVSDFTATPTSGVRPLLVNFTDQSTDATGWYWDFGDGTNSTEKNPGHVYANAGTYSVRLTAKNAGGSGDTVVKLDYITARIPGPVASFTATPTQGYVPLSVQFNDTSTNVPTAWSWDFGDYTSSNLQNPSHTYVTQGVYTVRLEVSNLGGSNTSVRPALINATQPKPNADFTGYPASGIAGETEFHFIDLSTNNPTAWDWNFGDGSPHATTKNATHIYQTKNNYYVALTATNAGGSDTETKGPIVVKNPRAIANFTGTPTLGSAPLTVQFTDTSSNFPNTWAWDFGDNTFARDIQNPVHTYNKAGSYTVTLAVNDTTAGQPASSITKRAYITVVNTPIAEFSASPTSGTAPLFVRFTDQSQGNPIRFYWKFGDGTFSNAKNPTHYYKRPGVYTVTETVQNAAGLNTTVKQNLITVTEMPQASFLVNATSGTAPKSIRFTDTSTGIPNSWNWEFGDGSPGSSEQNPVHTYYSSGVYSVQLTVSNAVGSSTVTKPSLITIGTPTGADFTFKPAEGDVPLMIQFTDNSAGGPIYIYRWQFGDGYTSREQNPVHTYTKPGNYTVSLTITTSTGAVSTISKEVVLTGTPVASFKANPTGGSNPLTVQFTDTSSNAPTEWFWTYGDGTYGNVRNPVHTYNSPGTYTVKLRASNSYGDDTVTYPGLISVSAFP